MNELLLYYLLGIILLPGIIFAGWAQAKVSSTFHKYAAIVSMRGVTAAQMARKLLDSYELNHIKVVQTHGTLSDHYHHRKKTVALSESVYNSTSLAALGVAAHEVGHALQYKDNYLPVKIRALLIPFVNISNILLWPLVILGIVLYAGFPAGSMAGEIIVYVGIGVFGLAVLFSLITLPTEYNASRRALKLLEQDGYLDPNEMEGAKKVLSAAALTYVAGLIVAILNLLRFVLTILLSRR
ncbi:MAG: zinc metallopeptidase [Firmicutes bacterium]|nr:zinc metallopeptidase [Bacillota bacterium]